jgi:Holliday junction resolvase
MSAARRWAIVKETRAAKRIGDFGEGLVTYALIRKGFEVACVDDIGADLIAAGRGSRYAVSVKTRLFRPGSKESRGYVIKWEDLRKLAVFSDRFGMVPLLAQVACLADKKLIHLFLFQAKQLAGVLPEVEHGYRIAFGPREVEAFSRHPTVDYTCWREELVGETWFGEAATLKESLEQPAM